MTNQPALYNIAKIRQLLHSRFYNNIMVINSVSSIVEANKEYISDCYCDWSANTIQIRFKKAFFKKIETENINFYTAINSIVLAPLLENNKKLFIEIFEQGLCIKYDEAIDAYIKQYLHMFYAITVISNNTLILYL